MGISIDGTRDLVSAGDGSLTIEGFSLNSTGIGTFSGGIKVGTAATVSDIGNIAAAGIVTANGGIQVGTAATIFANGNMTVSGILTASSFSGIDSDKISEGNTEVEAIDTGSDGHVKMTTEGTERIRIFSDGNVQMGTVTSIGNTAQAWSTTRTMFRIDGAQPVLYLSETDEQVGAQDAYFARSTEGLYIGNQGGDIFFQTSTDGVTTANRLKIDTGGHVTPTSDGSYDLGAIDYRWRNIYTADMQLSNEGSQNDVDGTWGQYTIQEGADDLFLINRRTGKKYKFMLEEVQ